MESTTQIIVNDSANEFNRDSSALSCFVNKQDEEYSDSDNDMHHQQHLGKPSKTVPKAYYLETAIHPNINTWGTVDLDDDACGYGYSSKLNPTDWVYYPQDAKALDDNTSNSEAAEDDFTLGDEEDESHSKNKPPRPGGFIP